MERINKPEQMKRAGLEIDKGRPFELKAQISKFFLQYSLTLFYDLLNYPLPKR